MNETTKPILGTEVTFTYGEVLDVALKAVQQLMQAKFEEAGYRYELRDEEFEQERFRLMAVQALHNAYTRCPPTE